MKTTRCKSAVAHELLTVLLAVTVTTSAWGATPPTSDATGSSARRTPPVPKPTLANVPYGSHERQVLDFWQADSDRPTPLVFVIHGGGWQGGEKERVNRFVNVEGLLAHRISVVAINYRLVPQARAAGIEPPVKAPLHDAARALQFVRSKAAEWNIDKARIGAAGGSAGACSSLWLAFHDDLADPRSSDRVARESTRLMCAAVIGAQTSLDPRQMKEWTPNSRYGGHAFGLSGFAEFLANREQLLPWIAEYSPYALMTADDPPVYLSYHAPPALGQPQKDPTHTANFGVKLQERGNDIGVPCELVYPGAPAVKHASAQDYLVAKLKAPEGDGRPNLVFILADDLGIVDINAYAERFTEAKPEQMFYETPHLDRLVREGTAFSQAYACQLCSPTRASILTGKNAARVGFTTAVGWTVRTFYNQAVSPPPGYLAQDALEWADAAIKIPQALLNGTTLDALPAGQPADQGRDEVTIAEALTGYRSAFIGKWHLGGHGSRGWQPHHQGFEAISYFDEGGSPYFKWQPAWDRRKLHHPKMPQPELQQGSSGGRLGHEYLTDELTEHAVRFIEGHARVPADAVRKPFFLYLCHFAVHTPFQAPTNEVARFEQKSTRGWNGHSNAVYAAMLKRLDDSIGRILETLAGTGFETNTAVVFMSDNGGVTYTDPVATCNAPFKGGKALHFEGGIRVPLVFRWPGRVPAGQWCDQPVDSSDLFPTLLELAGQEPATHNRLDGRSLVPLFADPANKKHRYPRDTFYWHYPLNVIVVNPDDGWPAAPHSTIREGDWKLLFDWSGVLKLYNIAKDPFERNELSARHPEKALALFRKLNDWLDANVATKYLPALNPDYDPAAEVRARPFVDLRKKHLGETRAIRRADSDPRFHILKPRSSQR